MKKYTIPLFLVVIICLAFQYKQQKPVDWTGNYTYEEEPVKANAGYSMVMEWKLTVAKKNNKDQGVLEIDGQQTYIKVLTDLSVDKNTITVIYNKLLDGIDPIDKKGDVLFVMKRNGGKIITQWAALTPRLLEKFPKECTCFVKQ